MKPSYRIRLNATVGMFGDLQEIEGLEMRALGIDDELE